MSADEEKTSPYRETAKIIVNSISSEHSNTFISQRIASAVLKPLLEGYIFPQMQKKFKFKQEWFT